MDLKNLVNVLSMMGRGEIEIVKIETDGETSPIARIGIERVSMKTDLIPPEKMRRILIESAKARLLNETRTFICTDCWDYLEMIRLKDLPNRPLCPKCGSPNLGMLSVEDYDAYPLVEKKNERLTKSERYLREQALETAKLISKYGKAAAIALSGRRLRISDVKFILARESKLTDMFFEMIMEAERESLKRRFW